MQAKIHPKYEEVKITCSCGHSFTTRSTVGKKDLHLEICSECHPFFTGKQKLVDTTGRVERFRKKYAKSSAKKAASKVKATPKTETKPKAKKAKKAETKPKAAKK